MRSTLYNPLPYLLACPVFSWAPNESMASVPPSLGSLMELLSCSDGSKAVGGGGRALSALDLTEAQVHLGMHGLWVLSCQHTHYNHIFICSCGVHLWLVSWESDCSGESPSVKEAVTEWI